VTRNDERDDGGGDDEEEEEEDPRATEKVHPKSGMPKKRAAG